MIRKLPRWTGRLAILVLSLLLMCIPPVFIASAAGYLPAVALVLAALICTVYLLVLYRGVTCVDVSRIYSCHRQDDMAFSLEVKNRTFFVCPRVEAVFYLSDVFGDLDTETPFSVTLAPKEVRQFDFDVRFDHIGKYNVGLKEVRIYGLLGIFAFKIPGMSSYQVEVKPKIWELEKLAVSDMVYTEDQRSRIKVSIDGGDYTGIREYVVGDPIKNIHWKLSAHANGYMTKQMEAYGNPGVTVILDLCSPSYVRDTMMDLFDGVVESAVSVCYYAQNNGLESDIYYLDRQGEENTFASRDAADLGDIVWHIPAITDDPEGYDVQRLLRRAGRDLYTKNNIVLCTTKVTSDTVQRMMEIKQARRTPILFFIIPKDVHDKERSELIQPLKYLDGAGIAYYVVDAAERLV